MFRWNLAFIPFLLCSCQTYRSNFDCQPGCGVPCTSVTEIERMIVETPDESPDIFLGYLPSPCSETSCLVRKVWIAEKELLSGMIVEGHYISLPIRAEP
jgi:hypothetical protein